MLPNTTRDKFAILYEVGRLVNSTLNLDEVLRLVMDTVIQLTGAERGFLTLMDRESGELKFRVLRDIERATIDSSEVSCTLIKRVAETGQPILAADAANHSELSQVQSVAIYGLRSVLCAPLQARGQVLGAVYVDNRFQRGVFTQEDLELVTAFANQAALAIDNARLYSDLQEAKVYQDRIFASVATGIVTLDVPGLRLQSSNAASEKILGCCAEHCLGKVYTDVLPPALSARLLRPMLTVIAPEAGAERLELDFVCDLPGRPQRFLNVRLSPLRDADQHTMGVVLAVDDLTEQRQLERARAEAESAHQLVKQVFGQFLSPKLVERFVADPALLQLPGERQEVTVLFADLRGYTSMSERLAPEEVVSLLNQYLTIAAEEIQASGGYLDKFIGDAVMGVYNVPEPLAEHPRLAIETALRIQRRLVALAERSGAPLRAGIGVNTGHAVVGTIGPRQAVNFTVIGDAVNVAQRLQGLARGGEVLVSATTAARAGRGLVAECLEPVMVKGRSEAVQVCRVARLNDLAAPLAAPPLAAIA